MALVWWLGTFAVSTMVFQSLYPSKIALAFELRRWLCTFHSQKISWLLVIRTFLLRYGAYQIELAFLSLSIICIDAPSLIWVATSRSGKLLLNVIANGAHLMFSESTVH